MNDSLSYIERARQRRATHERDASISAAILSQAEQVRRQARQLGRIAEAWQQVVPPHLVRQSTLIALQRGVLTVDLPSAAARYELESLLRQGLLRELRSCYVGSLNRIRTRIARNKGSSGPDCLPKPG